MSKDNEEYTVNDALIDICSVVDNLLAIIKRQKLSNEDFQAAKMEFNKFCSIRHKLKGGNSAYITNDN